MRVCGSRFGRYRSSLTVKAPLRSPQLQCGRTHTALLMTSMLKATLSGRHRVSSLRYRQPLLPRTLSITTLDRKNDDSCLLRVGGKMSERSQLTVTWLRSMQNIQVPSLRPRCHFGQYLKVQQKLFTRLYNIC